eukprot:3434_1
MDSLQKAMITYEALSENQKKAIDIVYGAFSGKRNKKNKTNKIVQGVGNGFAIYCSAKVSDRGAVLKCKGKCKKKCEVFKQETKIVRFPQILIFAIDRYINYEKFT